MSQHPRAVQYFSNEYLESCKNVTTEQVLQFLDDYQKLVGYGCLANDVERTLISMRVPNALLQAFKHRCQDTGKPYQTQIQDLMLDWLRS